jgi:hypothetical protein
MQVERNLNGGNSKPVIISNALVCKELCKLEEEIEAASLRAAETAERDGLESCDILFCREVGRAVAEENVACILHELGWYFQSSSCWQLNSSGSLDMVSDFMSWFMSLISWASRVVVLALMCYCPIWIEICGYSLLMLANSQINR